MHLLPFLIYILHTDNQALLMNLLLNPTTNSIIPKSVIKHNDIDSILTNVALQSITFPIKAAIETTVMIIFVC